MLSKLIKYDIRSTWRDFAAIYLSILMGVLVIPPLFNIDNNILKTFTALISAGIVIATIVVMIAMLFRIFNNNIYSKEGYLTMTLPVSSRQIVAAKLIVSSMWITLTGIVSTIGVIIFLYNVKAYTWPDIMPLISKAIDMLDSNGIIAIILIVIAMLVSTVKEIAKLFLACSIAHMKQLGRFRVIVGIISYFLLSWVENLIVQAFSLVVKYIPGTEEFLRQLDMMNNTSNIPQFTGVFSGVMGIAILYALVLTAIYALCTIWILSNKLELD